MRMAALLGATAAVVSFGSVAFASDSPQNPQQQSPHRSSAAAAVPNACLKFAQPAGSGGGHYRNTDNAPWTYTSATYGGNWFNIACGSTKFTVPRGQQALVSLAATAELDCNATGTANVDGWCEGRFTVNGKPALPDNSGRGDTYAWDSTNGGVYNWSAHQLSQTLVLSCPRSATTTVPCAYTAQLQGRFQHNASSLWLDDLTTAVDVTVGKVVTTTAPATP